MTLKKILLFKYQKKKRKRQEIAENALKEPDLKETRAPQCSLQHCL